MSGNNKPGGGGKVPPPSSQGGGKVYQHVTPPPVGGGGGALLIPVLVAVILVLLTIIFLWTRKSRKGRSVLIVGPCDSGKTAIFTQLLGGGDDDGPSQTVTSLIPNQLEYELKNGKPALLIKDLPGHDRVQIKFWDEHKGGARGIVCVVDAAGGSKGIREAADVIYRVLTDPSVNSVCPSVLIFANKQDQPMSKGTKVIKNQLEKELTTLRMTKSASLSSTGGKEHSSRMLGRSDRDFEFDQITNLDIQFAEGSAAGENKNDLESSLGDWLASIA